jgi:hypothetical protein
MANSLISRVYDVLTRHRACHLPTGRVVHCGARVMMELTPIATGAGETPNAIVSELVISDVDVVPVTCTCCPM